MFGSSISFDFGSYQPVIGLEVSLAVVVAVPTKEKVFNWLRR
jgi:hypothetical protein